MFWKKNKSITIREEVSSQIYNGFRTAYWVEKYYAGSEKNFYQCSNCLCGEDKVALYCCHCGRKMTNYTDLKEEPLDVCAPA